MIFWLKPMALALTLHHINTNKLSGPKVFTKQLPALHFLMPPFRRSLELISVPLPLPHGWSEAHVDTYKQWRCGYSASLYRSQGNSNLTVCRMTFFAKYKWGRLHQDILLIFKCWKPCKSYRSFWQFGPCYISQFYLETLIEFLLLFSLVSQYMWQEYFFPKRLSVVAFW